MPGSRIMDSLRARGFRATGPRRAVVEAALRRSGRFTAREILSESAARGVGRATVFRTLDLLADLGILNRIHAEDGCHAYAVCIDEHHHHLVCNGCGSVQEVTAPAVEQYVRSIAQDAGFQLQGHHLEVFGLCQRCQKS